MKKPATFTICLLLVSVLFSQTLIIEENAAGLCNYDGVIGNAQPGFTGDGYINIDGGEGASINYSIETLKDSICNLRWRYAIGGSNQTARNALLILDDSLVIDTVFFPFTGSWDIWHYTDTLSLELSAGKHKIRLASIPSTGLANLDHLVIEGAGIQPASCKPSYTFALAKNFENAGEVWFEPELIVYEEGTEITVHAVANTNYFFHSWRGEESSVQTDFTFQIKQNTIARAMFYPKGTAPIDSVTGYASIQHNNGTPFMMIGGALGKTVNASTFTELKQYLEVEEPYVVQINKRIEGAEALNIASNKTLVGVNDSSYLKGIRLDISNAENVIVQNLKLSHVLQYDIIEINGGSKNIWLNHLDLFNDREHGTEYYDGILDIKNKSSFITVSWCKIHDHFKTILIGSGDQASYDSVARLTFHHNYFYNCESRLPSIRFGKAHIFNNYFKNCGTAVNSRMGACVRVEKNYFSGVGTAVMMEYSIEKGAVELIDNHFGTSRVSVQPSCLLNLPYDYSLFLDSVHHIPEIVGADIINNIYTNEIQSCSLKLYPNPTTNLLTIEYELTSNQAIHIFIYNDLGVKIHNFNTVKGFPGRNFLPLNTSGFKNGIYFIQLQSNSLSLKRKFIISS